MDFGRNIYTLRDVVDEIRDKATRRSLAFLPYQLIFREPRPELITLVTEFSKKTGDYPSLSATDIKVLALTYQLEQEHVGAGHLKKEPERKVYVQSTKRHPEAPVNVAGFHLPAQRPVEDRKAQPSQPEATRDAGSEHFNSFQFWREPVPALDSELLGLLDLAEAPRSGSERQEGRTGGQTSNTDSSSEQFSSFLFWREPPRPLDSELLELLDACGISSESQQPDDKSNDQLDEQSDDVDKENDAEDEDEEGGGWITPSNIGKVKLDCADWTAPANVTVGCLTTDFAMQNVLIQIGLHVLSVNGMLIKQSRSYILRCHACFRTTSNMSKVFCPHCGNQTLKKVAVTLNDDGSLHMHFSKNPKVLNPSGLRYSLPKPQGGKHANNPLLVEDQRFPQQRLSRKARQKTDVFNPDYVAGGSPFCENDIYSRAANLQIRDGHCGGGRRRANPNAARRKFVKKK